MHLLTLNRVNKINQLHSNGDGKSAGFTLIEVIVVIGIVGILAAIALPSYKNSIASNRMGPNANGLVGALNLARLEAIKRSEHVIVAPTTGSDWSKGISIWVDSNRSGTLDSTETALKKINSLEGSGKFEPVGTVSSVVFYSTGFISVASVTFTLCDDRIKEQGRKINILKSGRIRTDDITCI